MRRLSSCMRDREYVARRRGATALPPVGAQIDERVIDHRDEGALRERDPALAVVLDDLDLAHAVAHRSSRVVVRAKLVECTFLRATDREALRTVAGGDVGVEIAAALEVRVTE